MGTNVTDKEVLFLDLVENEIGQKGYTEKKCPRCGNDIILERLGSSYSIRCKTDGCIKLDYRGI